jgi:type III restriction enzyme
MSDFSLMNAIECGIVKLPRVPVADNIPGGDMPKFHNLWEHIRTRMPKEGRGKSQTLDLLSLPAELQTALAALYGHYENTYHLWAVAGIAVPPCFIVVCNNTSTSKSRAFTASTRTGPRPWEMAASNYSATSTSTATRSADPGPC